MSILLESGSFLLEEDGASKLLLESGSGGGGSGAITALRHTLGTNRIRGVATRFVGAGTSWTQGGTTFSLSGTAASGSSILTTIVNSNTDATLVIATGGTSGQLVISDGVNDVTIQVKPLHRTKWIPSLSR